MSHLITINAIVSNTNTVTTITTILKGMKVKCSGNFDGNNVNWIKTRRLYLGCQKNITAKSQE